MKVPCLTGYGGTAFRTVLLCLLTFILGCARQKEKPVFKVAGQLTYYGTPMSKAMISFYPVDGNNRKLPSHGIANKDGRYILRTYRQDDGAPSGECVVTITWPGPRVRRAEDGESEEDVSSPDRLKNAYSRAATTKLRATVQPIDNTIDFHLP